MTRMPIACGVALLLVCLTISCAPLALFDGLISNAEPPDSQTEGAVETGVFRLWTSVAPATEAEGVPGAIIGTAPGLYARGTHVTLLAQAARGWRFGYWETDIEGTDPLIEFVLDQDYDVTAVFVRQFELKVRQVGVGGSVWEVAEDGRAMSVRGRYDVDEVVTLTATPEEGWRFEGWSGAVRASDATVEVPMDRVLADSSGVIEVQATFAEIVGLSARVIGDGRIVSPDGLFESAADVAYDAVVGGTVQLTAEPATGWVFWGWQGEIPTGHACLQTLTLTMDHPRQVEAIFAPLDGFRSGHVLSLDFSGMFEGGGDGGGMPLSFMNASMTSCSVQSLTGQETRFFAVGWNGVSLPFAVVGRVNCDRVDVYPLDSFGLIPLVQGLLGIKFTGRLEANGAVQIGATVTHDFGFGQVSTSGPVLLGLESSLGGARVVELTRPDPENPGNLLTFPGVMVLAVNGNDAKGHLFFGGFRNGFAVAWEIRGRQTDSTWTFELRTREKQDGNLLEWATTITPAIDETNGDWEVTIAEDSHPFQAGDRIITRERIDPFAFRLDFPF